MPRLRQRFHVAVPLCQRSLMRKRLGELLIDAGLLDEHQLQAALGHQRQWGGRLGQALVHMQLVSEDRMVRVLALQLGIPVADPPPYDLHGRVLGEISLELARQHHVFPLALRRDAKGEQLAIAMSDPTNVATLDAVQFTTGKKVVPYIAGDGAIEGWIRRHYQGERPVASGLAATIAQANAQMGVQFGGQTVDLGSDDDIPVVTGAIVAADPSTSLAGPDPFAAIALSTPTPFAMSTSPFAVPGQQAPGELAPPGGLGQSFVLSAPTPTPGSANVPVRAPDQPSVLSAPTPTPGGANAPAFAPLASVSAADAWARHVEQPNAVFGAAGGFLGASDDDDPAVTAAFSVGPATVAHSEPAPADPFALTAQQAAAAAIDEVELELTDAEEPIALPPLPTVAAVAPVVEAGPSWGDLLDVPAHLAVPAPAPVAPASPVTIEFATVPVVTVAPTEQTCSRCANVRVAAARFCPFCGLSFVDAPSSSVPVAAVALPVVEEVALPAIHAAAAAPVASIDDRPIELSAGFTIDVLEVEALLPPPIAPMVRSEPEAPPAPAVVADVEHAVPSAPLLATEPVAIAGPGPAAATPVDSDWSDLIDDTPPPMPVAALAQSFAPIVSTAIGLTDGAPDVEAIELSAAFPVAAPAPAPADEPPPVDATGGGAANEVDALESIEISSSFPVARPPVDNGDVVHAPEPLAPSPEDLSLSPPVDGAPTPGEAAPQAPPDAPLLVDLAAIGLTAAQTPADAAPTLADQWADAAERQIPRKESDRRNDIGWVPPSRELVVIPEPAAPAPEPVAAYTPAAPPAPVVAVAPWALFAAPSVEPVLSVEPAGAQAEAPVAAAAPAEPGARATPPANHLETQQNSAGNVEAIAAQPLHVPDMSDVEVIPLPSTHVLAADAADASTAHAAPEQAAPEQLDDSDLGELDDLDMSDLSDVSDAEPSVVLAPDLVAIELPAVLVETAAVEVPPVAPLVVGWGDMVDPVVAPQPEVRVESTDVSAVATPSLSAPAGISEPASLLSPATFAPPASVGASDIVVDVDVDLALPLMPPPIVAADADDPFNVPVAPIAAVGLPPTKVTATMVMKLDPAEQKRLLEMLLSKTEISPTELSQPPRQADPDEQK
jgi:hypothetical protein